VLSVVILAGDGEMLEYALTTVNDNQDVE